MSMALSLDKIYKWKRGFRLLCFSLWLLLDSIWTPTVSSFTRFIMKVKDHFIPGSNLAERENIEEISAALWESSIAYTLPIGKNGYCALVCLNFNYSLCNRTPVNLKPALYESLIQINHFSNYFKCKGYIDREKTLQDTWICYI